MAKARISNGRPDTAFALEVSTVIGRDGHEDLYFDRVELSNGKKTLIIRVRAKRARRLAQWILDNTTE